MLVGRSVLHLVGAQVAEPLAIGLDVLWLEVGLVSTDWDEVGPLISALLPLW